MFSKEEIENIIKRNGKKVKITKIVRDNMETITKLREDGFTFKVIAEAFAEKYETQIRYQSFAGTYIRLMNEEEENNA